MSEAISKNKVLLGVTGSIAAYKSAEIARLLVSRGYQVRVVMTASATRFISPLTLQSVTGQPVTTEFWEEEDTEISHIELADWADVVLVAPATADFLARVRQGMAGDPLTAIVLASKAPLLFAPAMNVNMWENPRTQENVRVLREQGVGFVEPGVGALACGWNGSGRLAEPWDIFHCTLRCLSNGDYAGRKVLISTGPTREAIDPVRYLSNRSSGKMGVSLAREAFRRGADVTLVHGPVNVKVPNGITCIPVTSALEMHEQMLSLAYDVQSPPDVVIMAAAVADYRPKEANSSKIKKTNGLSSIALVENPDILHDIGEKRGESVSPLLIGFAVETGEIEELLVQLQAKIEKKRVDLIIGNLAQDAFDLDTNRVWMVDKYGKQEEVATTFKSRVAKKILNRVLKL